MGLRGARPSPFYGAGLEDHPGGGRRVGGASPGGAVHALLRQGLAPVLRQVRRLVPLRSGCPALRLCPLYDAAYAEEFWVPARLIIGLGDDPEEVPDYLPEGWTPD